MNLEKEWHLPRVGRPDLKEGFSCSGQVTLQDPHLSGLTVNLLKSNTAENPGWMFPTPKFTVNVGFVFLSKIAPSRGEQQTQPYDQPLHSTALPLRDLCHIPLIPGTAETQSRVRCHAIPCSTGAPASRNTARSIVHLIRTFNCFSPTQGYCFPNKRENPAGPQPARSPSCVATGGDGAAWMGGRRTRKMRRAGPCPVAPQPTGVRYPPACRGPARTALCRHCSPREHD